MQNVQRAAFMLLCAGCSSLSESTFDENSAHVVAQIRKTERTSTGTHRIGYFVEHTLDWGDCARNGSDDPFELKKRRQRRMLADELQAMVTKAGAADGQFAQRDWLEDGTLSLPTTYRVQQQVQFVPISAMGQNAATLSLELIVRPKTNGEVEKLTLREEDLKRLAERQMSDSTHSAFKTYDDILTAFSERIQTRCARGVVESIGVDIASIGLNSAEYYRRRSEKIRSSLDALAMVDGELNIDKVRKLVDEAQANITVYDANALALRYRDVLEKSFSDNPSEQSDQIGWVLLLSSAWIAAQQFQDGVAIFSTKLKEKVFRVRDHSPLSALDFFLIDIRTFSGIIGHWSSIKRSFLDRCKDKIRDNPLKTLREWCDRADTYGLQSDPTHMPAHTLRDKQKGRYYHEYAPFIFPPEMGEAYELRSDVWERFVFVDGLEELHNKTYPEGYINADESIVIDGLKFSLEEGFQSRPIARIGNGAPIFVAQMRRVPVKKEQMSDDILPLAATSIFLHALRERCVGVESADTCSERLDAVFFPEHWGAWSDANLDHILSTMRDKLEKLKSLHRRVESSVSHFSPESQDAALDLRGKLRDLIANDEAVLGWLESIRITHMVMSGG